MRNKRQGRRTAWHATVRTLLDHARYEVLPTSSALDTVREHLPAGRMVTVTASPGRGLAATLDLAEQLAAAGYHAVPHVAARMVHDRAELAEIADRLTGRGITSVFVPSGDAEPVGDYPDALALVADLTALGSPFAHVGVTAYPESHPVIADDVTIQAMWDKRRHATELVSNLTFDARVWAEWLARVRARGVTMPLWLGLPGPVERARLLAVATRIGVGDSARYLVKHRGAMARLAAPGGFDGEQFLRDVAPAVARPEAQVVGLHVFTFSQVAQTEAWRTDLLARLGGPPGSPPEEHPGSR